MQKVKINIVELGRAVREIDCGNKRPCVVLSKDGTTAKVLEITSRNKYSDSRYVRMNDYIIHGYCNCSRIYNVPVKYIGAFKRTTTMSENNKIKQGLRSNGICTVLQDLYLD